MPSRVKTALFSGFNKAVNLAAGSGLSKIPGVNATYHLIFKTLWPDRNIIEVEGSRMYVNLKDELLLRKTFEAYITTPHWDELTTGIFKSVVKEGDVVLDLGANLGYYTLLAARLVGKKGRVYAFEPEPRNYRLLLKNIELNHYDNVAALQKAVSDRNGVVQLHMSRSDSGAHTIRDSIDRNDFQDFVEIEAVRLDDFFADKPHPINVVKMDVEGFEPQAFSGMERVLRENPGLKLFVEFFPALIREAGSSPEEFARHLMEDLRFSVLAVDDDWKDRKQQRVTSVTELMNFMKDKTIINLFLER